MIQDVDTPSNFVAFTVNGPLTDNGVYKTVPVVYIDKGGTLLDGADLSITFSRTGDKGETGDAATVGVGTVTTLAAGASATVTNVGTSGAAVLDFALPRGATGLTGATGATGATGNSAGLRYLWSIATDLSDPTSGKVKINSLSPATASLVHISEADQLGNGVAGLLDLWDDSTSSTKGVLTIVDTANGANFASFQVNGAITDQGVWKTVPVVHIASGGALAASAVLAVTFVRTGDKGETGSAGAAATVAVGTVTTGAAGSSADVDNVGSSSAAVLDFVIPRGAVGADGRPAGFSYLWDDGITAADPGSGKLRISSANVTAATSMHINETDRLGVAIAAILNTWDDSTQPSNKGTIVV
ncbi:MAG: hypothetical protein K0R41_1530, partial [Geminicoccaceae bacterium]|nr:hypothetical protein [Geminicoccaceae bacterium]